MSEPIRNRPEVSAPRGAEVRYEAIEKKYGGAYALQPTRLAIQAGEFFSIIGPSGSGKSTLLGVTVGFVQPSGGRILVEGTDIVGVPAFRRNIGMVFQSYSLFPHMSAADNIAFPLQMRRIAKTEIRSRVESALAMVRLQGMGERMPSQLSGGQRQRVALARAAVYNPGLLLMDEPLSALDKNLREEMQSEIKQFQRSLGSTVLYVTHDQNEATFMSDRIAVMNNGAIAQVGTSAEVYQHPRNKFVASFLGEANIFEVDEIADAGNTRTIRTREGFDLRSNSKAPSADGIAVCIRPEHITLGKTATDGENSLTGEVVDIVFSSGNLVYRIRVGGRIDIIQRVPAGGGRFHPEHGETVTLSWSPDHTLLVAD